MTGLRERKKQRTRDALIRAAHELFVSKGYEASTIDEITLAVDVSQRTFFRYFASKEEVALALQALIEERYLLAVRERPPHESPLEALRNSLEQSWTGIGETVSEIVSTELYMQMWRVIETTPALLAVLLRRSVELDERLAAEIARREGVDVERDPRPRVLVAAFGGVLRTAAHRWASAGDVTLRAARAVITEHVDHLTAALGDDWRTPRRPAEPTRIRSAESR